MRKYTNIDYYLDLLEQDIYDQPADEGHTDWSKDVINEFTPDDVDTVLDLGCGEGFCQPLFANLDIEWTGVTLGEHDLKKARFHGKQVTKTDVSFLTDFADDSYDMVFGRHILEHSPFPLLSLMEWHRVAKKYLLLVYPAPDYWGWYGKNHYYILTKSQLWWVLARAGWHIIEQEDFTTSDELFLKHYMKEQEDDTKKWAGPPKIVEYRILCEKGESQTE